MQRQIPDPMTIEDLVRDPQLIYAIRARGRRICLAESSQMLGNLFRELRSAVEAISSTWRARKTVADVCGTRLWKGLVSHFPAWV